MTRSITARSHTERQEPTSCSTVNHVAELSRPLWQHLENRVMRENPRIGMRIDLEVLNSVDFIITTSTIDSECVSVCM